MKITRKPSVRAALAMLGTIIGAGIFGVPAAVNENGILGSSLIFWVIALVVLATHLLYVDVLLRAPGMMERRLPGQVKKLLGSAIAPVGFLAHPLYILGACFAYLVLGGEFLAVLAPSAGLPSSPLLWQVVFWVGGAITVFVGLRFVAKVESGMTFLLVALLLGSVAVLIPGADGRLFVQARWGDVLQSVGIFLFALSGLPVVPEIVALLDRDPLRSRVAVTIGSLTAAFLTWLIGVFAVAYFGDATPSNAAGLSAAFPSSVFWLLPLIGFLAVSTSFITLIQDLKAMLRLDLGLRKYAAWGLALGTPLALLFIIHRDFLSIIGIVGSLFGTVIGLLIVAMAFKVRSRDKGPVTQRFGIPVFAGVVFLTVFIWRILSIVHP